MYCQIATRDNSFQARCICRPKDMTDNKMGGKYHTVGIILKSNRKLVKQSQNYTPNTHIHDRSFSWIGTGVSIKCGVVS